MRSSGVFVILVGILAASVNSDKGCVTGNGADYTGSWSTTVSGTGCQRWDSQHPHSHDSYHSSFDFADDFISEAANHCRNPNGDERAPWCYTTDPATRWEYCDLPQCGGGGLDCLSSDDGSDYTGHTSVTSSGTTCQSWDSQSPHEHSDYDSGFDFPDSFISDASNKCRNPKGDEGAPWCYTTDPDKRWELCDIPLCAAAPVALCPNRVFASLGGYLPFTCRVMSRQPLKEFRMQVDSRPGHSAQRHSAHGISFIQYQVVDPIHYDVSFHWDRVTVGDLGSYFLHLANDVGSATFIIDIARNGSTGVTGSECYSSSVSYGGTLSTTVSGRMCQRWEQQTPHSSTSYYTGSDFVDGSVDGAAGYCRSPGGNPKPWCFTMDPHREWEYCDVPRC